MGRFLNSSKSFILGTIFILASHMPISAQGSLSNEATVFAKTCLVQAKSGDFGGTAKAASRLGFKDQSRQVSYGKSKTFKIFENPRNATQIWIGVAGKSAKSCYVVFKLQGNFKEPTTFREELNLGKHLGTIHLAELNHLLPQFHESLGGKLRKGPRTISDANGVATLSYQSARYGETAAFKLDYRFK